MHNRLRKLRVGRGFETQKEFCSHAQKYSYNIDSVRYGRIEQGVVAPTIYEVRDICEAMKISADAWLFGVESRVDLRGLDSYDIAMLANIADMMRGRR